MPPLLLVLCGADFWILGKNEERKIQAEYMRLLISVTEYHLLDKKRNEYIRRELNIFKLGEKAQHYRNNQKEHDVFRMAGHHIPKSILNYKPKFIRNVGRPKKRCVPFNCFSFHFPYFHCHCHRVSAGCNGWSKYSFIDYYFAMFDSSLIRAWIFVCID